MARTPRSLQGRLLALVLGAVALVWLGAAVAIWFDARHELDELLDGHLAQAATLLIAQQVHGEGDDEHEDREYDATPPPSRYGTRVAFQVWHEGRLALRSPSAPSEPLSRHTRGFETRDIDGTAWRVVAAQGAEHDVQVYVAEQLASRGAILWALLRSMLWPMALALPLLALLAWWAVRRGLAPLQRLSATLAQRPPQALDDVQLDDPPAEMQPLVAALNGLFTRIASLIESERRFTADAAHELRTPIAAIRAQAQVALGSRGGDEQHHALRATLEGCDRATRLVEQLLTLARLEAAPDTANTRTDLSRLARRVIADLAGNALAQQQTIELDAPDACELRADETLLGILLRNLVDNAIRYSPAGARVRIAITGTPTHTTLCVEDSGPGLTDEQRARLGERFFRVLGNDQPGSGLGWSIARRIATVQAATLSASRSAALGGLAVTVVWPHADQPAP
jgi:two-component system, OmpR family, sensor histidine kinase QseC